MLKKSAKLLNSTVISNCVYTNRKFDRKNFFNNSLIRLVHGESTYEQEKQLGLLHPKITKLDKRIDLKLPNISKPLHISYLWLRDHCRCSECYNHKTFQRQADVQQIKQDLKPIYLKSTETNIYIQWPDGHESQYDYQFLSENLFESKIKPPDSKLWTNSAFPTFAEISVECTEFQSSKSTQKKFMESIFEHGIGIVSGVEATLEATRKVIETICPVKRSFFGEMWNIKSDLDHADTAYSKDFLGAHSEATFSTESLRIQVFHCLQAAEVGGETLLVDGFAVAEQFKKHCPDGYDFLSQFAIPTEYKGDDQFQVSLDFIFKHHPVTQKIKQFRYNIYDRSPLSTIPYDKVDNYYDYLLKLTAIVRDPSNEFWFKLQPGDVIFIDNWRVMHGRNQFTGLRDMGGCYVDNSEFLSKARILGLNID